MVIQDKANEAINQLDAHSVFVRNLPYSLSDSQLQNVFSEVGPVRRCFTVKEKGSDQHRGFGFVQYAVVQDALQAVELKNGADLQGRKIKVELAKRRAPLEERRLPKHNDLEVKNKESDTCTRSQGGPTSVKSSDSDVSKKRDGATDEKIENEKIGGEMRTKKAKKDLDVKNKESNACRGSQGGSTRIKSLDLDVSKKRERAIDERTEEEKIGGEVRTKKARKGDDCQLWKKNNVTRKRSFEEGKSSEKQRIARTVILGGLVSSEMREEAIARAKKIGCIESVQACLASEELNSRGLARDGCKLGSAAVIYSSVKAACLAVAALHQNPIGGGIVWARQLGGEGSKPRKWRVIVRNLPFQVTENDLRELFSSVGFIWEISIPRNAAGLSKGFAFASFTSKVDAEKAIKNINGKLIGKRPVAVDWAIAKKFYETTMSSPDSGNTKDVVNKDDLSCDEDTASEDGEEDITMKLPKKRRMVVEARKQIPLTNGHREKEDNDNLESDSEAEEDQLTVQSEKPDAYNEMEMARQVLNKVVASALDKDQISDSSEETSGGEESEEFNLSNQQGKASSFSVEDMAGKKSRVELEENFGGEEQKGEGTSGVVDKENFKRTLFIKNLPFEAKANDVRKHFSAFGKVNSVHLVHHPITKRPKGTAFLEFATTEAAQAAVSAAAKYGGEASKQIVFGGRELIVLMALEKSAVHTLTKERLEKDNVDRRNLHLAKEGQIQEGTSAAAGVSEEDLRKRKELEREKSTKLRSPNFHVSKTRLAVYNVPKSMNEAELKKLFIDAVLSRASKQHPVIKQVKILKDERKGGRSRGICFVEFTEHQHALVALRVLNNNPGTFGPERRPIVEFAIENSQALKKRRERLKNVKQQVGPLESGRRRDPETGSTKMVMKNKAAVKKDASMNDSDGLPKIIEKGKQKEMEGQRKQQIRNNRKLKHSKNFSAIKKQNSDEQIDSPGGIDRTSHKGPSYGEEILHSKSTKFGTKKRRVQSWDEDSEKKKGIWQGKQDQRTSTNKKTKQRNQRKRGSGPELEDKLDKLMTEYRSKYFTNSSKSSKVGSANTSSRADEDIKRWFD